MTKVYYRAYEKEYRVWFQMTEILIVAEKLLIDRQQLPKSCRDIATKGLGWADTYSLAKCWTFDKLICYSVSDSKNLDNNCICDWYRIKHWLYKTWNIVSTGILWETTDLKHNLIVLKCLSFKK